MFSTFKIENGNMMIATKLWSDFSATIPLIRSFSLGSNFPPQYPLFSGPPIRYHFIFFMLVGALEKIGFGLDWALNSLSAISFTIFLFMIYRLGVKIFKKPQVGLLAVFLTLFNGSFAFLEFFKKYPLSINSLKQILVNTNFASFGPYDGKVVSAFWSLNIYTNQRHLAFAYASFLVLILIFYSWNKNPKNINTKQAFLVGIFVGIFPFIHLAVFAMMFASLSIFFVVYPKLRKILLLSLVVSLGLALPQILYMGNSQIKTQLFSPGYLIDNLTFFSFLKYWALNLGLGIILAPLGFLILTREKKKIFLPFFALFILGNLFQFSPEMAANHKFFNLYIVGANLLIAFVLLKIWNINFYSKISVIIMAFFLTLSGFIDFFPIVNDRLITLADYSKDKTVLFIIENTPRDSVFMNSSFLYYPASLAGRKIFLGWPYFAWSAGYDTNQRGKIISEIYSGNDKKAVCALLKQNKIDYFSIEDTRYNNDFPNINLSFFKGNFTPFYNNTDGSFSIIKVDDNCN